jgi:ABC-type nitrate/sulfonate/bicarbonate transport system substrate-binding protein
MGRRTVVALAPTGSNDVKSKQTGGIPMTTRRNILTGGLTLGATLALSDLARAQAAKEKVRMGATISLEMILPVLVAWQKGHFTSKGIDFEFISLGGAQTRTALAAGEINFSMFHIAPVWIAVENGLPFRFISMYTTKEIFGVLVRKDLADSVKSMNDLRGMRGMCFTPGSASYAVSAFYLKRGNLDITKDVKMTFVSSADPKIWINAVETGKVDFLSGVWEPIFTVALDRGKVAPLLDVTVPRQHDEILGGDVATLGVVTTTSLIESNPKLVKDVMAAVNQGLTDLLRSSTKELAEMSLATGVVKMDPDLLTRILDRVRHNFEVDGRPSVSKYARAVDVYLEGGYLKKPVPFESVVAEIAGRKA